jgi:DNA-binding PadR family transcriptional regulator
MRGHRGMHGHCGPGGPGPGGGGRHGHHGRMGPPFGPPWGPPARRARRGDVRLALLTLLAEKPMHGYEIIGELEQRSNGAWRPSPGSIYPALQLLADEGLLTADEQDGRRVYSITEAGKAELEERMARGDKSPWDQAEETDDETLRLRETVFRLMGAARQVGEAGTAAQLKAAAGILDEARRKIYALLAEEDAAAESDG